MDHHGPEHTLMRTAPAFIEWRQQQGLGFEHYKTFTLYFGDPADNGMVSLAVEVDHDHYPLASGMRYLELAPCRYATVRHTGPWSGVSHSVDFLYRDWLPQSGETPANQPLMIQRLNHPSQVPEDKLTSVVFLPLA